MIIPNLLLYEGSILLLDVKDGVSTAVTAEHRRRFGPVHVIDPFKQSSYAGELASFDPLADLDPSSPSFPTDVIYIADSFVIPDSGKNAAHFDDGAQALFESLIAHIVITIEQPIDMFDVGTATQPGGELLEVVEIDGVANALRSIRLDRELHRVNTRHML